MIEQLKKHWATLNPGGKEILAEEISEFLSGVHYPLNSGIELNAARELVNRYEMKYGELKMPEERLDRVVSLGCLSEFLTTFDIEDSQFDSRY